ncbi:Cache domain-containing protein [Rhizobium sp. RU33A]|uniref:cache domain-containing protein n=1 Tax=Rhizobium sp. RU33A TaxID=1907413 RepID=UPI000956C175|nr:cache domain-containing protein [Rhizobium sp. RU33A]SIQ83721.1 Cache domain-containing protein [Rhizobium sp. RU33A]
MSEYHAHKRLPSLATITIGFVLISAMVGLGTAYVLISERARSFEEASLQRALETRTRGIQTAIAQALYREWNALSAISEQASGLPLTDLQDRLNGVSGDGSIVSWAGLAEPDGTVIAATNGLLVGRNVGERPWFLQGLKGKYAGDVHEAVLLAALLRPQDEPMRFIDFAVPFLDQEGAVRGVVGLHLDVSWIKRLVDELAHALNVDIVIVGANGEISASSVSDLPDLSGLGSLQRARSGVLGTSLERWPDGGLYFTLTVPELTYNDLPKFGWNIVARIDGRAATVPAREMSDYLIVRLLGMATILLLLTALYVVAFVRPFARLAANAMEIANGKDTYPMESNRTREMSMLSTALARLQAHSQRHDRDPGS